MDILPHYQAYVQKVEGRSLIQYLSCHHMSLDSDTEGTSKPSCVRDSSKVIFVVMRNFLPTKMWMTFDLKGNTMRRRVLSKRALFGDGEPVPDEYGTLRDWECLDANMTVDVSLHDKARIASIVDEDTKFLASQNLLDYSLLLGIHRFPSDMPAAKRDAQIKQLLAAGGYLSIDQRKVYFFGIIDILEKYSCGWRMQNAVLTVACLCSCRGRLGVDSISAMPPAEYADRFATFVREEVLRSEGPVYEEKQIDKNRWRHLWQLRRGCMVLDRLQCEDADKTQRIRDLEESLQAKELLVGSS